MTSQLNVDTIVDKAGSGGSNVKMANTSTYVSDGGNVTQNTVQGLAKAWVNYDGGSPASGRDSFNLSSITDNSAGNYTLTIANAMANINFSLAGMAGAATNNQYIMAQPRNSVTPTTTATNVNCSYANSYVGDAQFQSVVYFGDLA